MKVVGRLTTQSWAEIDSLELPYKAGLPETGLQRLARGLIDRIDIIPVEERRPLFQGMLEPAEAAALVHRLAFMAVQLPRFHGLDINVIRAIPFTLADDAPIHSAVIQWLRCEDFSRYDRELIGDMVPRPQSQSATATIQSLGRLMHAVHDAAFVLLVDEMESYFDHSGNEEGREADIRSAVNAPVEIADSVNLVQ